MSVETDINTLPSFTRSVRRRSRLVDVAVILSVPVVLGLVYLLPQPVRRSLVFDYTDPSLPTAFASTFVHLGSTHLFVNLLTYALVVPVVYLLSVTSGRRYRFYSAFLTFMFAFPFVLSYLNLAILRPSVSFGFSGIVMAFVGFLPLALAEFLDTNFDIGPKTSIAPMLFFVGIALISALSVQSIIPENGTVLLGNSGLVLVALLSALLYALSACDEGSAFRSKLRSAIDAGGYVELAAIALILFLAFPFVAFPGNVSLGGGELNLYVHLLGYSLGFMVAYVTVETTARVWPTESGSSPV